MSPPWGSRKASARRCLASLTEGVMHIVLLSIRAPNPYNPLRRFDCDVMIGQLVTKVSRQRLDPKSTISQLDTQQATPIALAMTFCYSHTIQPTFSNRCHTRNQSSHAMPSRTNNQHPMVKHEAAQ